MGKRKTTEQFIDKAIKIHGDKYDYSLVDYKNTRTKIKIICKKHGPFDQEPARHLSGRKCKKCQIESRRKTTEQFIDKAIKIHGDKYDYSQIDYKNKRTKIKIICKKHGPFEQLPGSHVLGRGGCKKCNLESQTRTIEQFIQESILLHGDVYDYSLVDYKNAVTKVKIICKKHGVFEQIPQGHLSGQKCKKCEIESRIKTTEQFIDKAIKIHGDKYDYSQVACNGCHTKVKIICKKHGIFEQEAKSHLDGCGCAKCGVEFRTKTTEHFIQESILLHGDVYDYSHVDYKNNNIKVKIICKKHGVFEQEPYSHLRGHGCKKCRFEKTTSLGEKEFLDELKIPESDRQFAIPSANYIADGIHKSTNTIVEYLGDYWHGNPLTYAPSIKIAGTSKTCEDVYKETFNRFAHIKSLGYNVKYIWESDWQAWKKNPDDPIPIKEYNG